MGGPAPASGWWQDCSAKVIPPLGRPQDQPSTAATSPARGSDILGNVTDPVLLATEVCPTLTYFSSSFFSANRCELHFTVQFCAELRFVFLTLPRTHAHTEKPIAHKPGNTFSIIFLVYNFVSSTRLTEIFRSLVLLGAL